ncbi:MAG TPA: glycosyltransferase [Myxococcota bacterium]|nr:glycosyltransferase [Myxococcota bacterium]
MKVVLVHDWLTGMRGGERVLEELAGLFPDAELFTLIHVPGSTSPRIEALRITASPLSRLPGAPRHYRKLLPLFPWAIERMALPPCDLVLSTSHAVAKAVRPPPGALHLSYVFTPMRYVWDQADAYLGRGLRRVAAAPLAAYLRSFDRRTSGPERIHRVVAISRTIAERIRRSWNREASVVFPPVGVERFAPRAAPPDDFYLVVGGFVPYKREDVALAAFAKLGRPLVVAGDGPSRRALEAAAPPNARFVGRTTDAELADLYARCRALVYPQDEDFGIVPVECMAAGRPVIALGRGGASETVVPLDAAGARAPTGVWFDAQTPDALAEAVLRYEREEKSFDPRAIRRHAESFSGDRFRREILAEIAAAGSEHPTAIPVHHPAQ